MRFWACSLAVLVAAGIGSRLLHTGNILFDKYLGDALYAAMVYAILRLFRRRAAVPAMVIMTALEFFQLTLIPAHMLGNSHLAVRIAARLLGTQFSFLDLLAYAVGIGALRLSDAHQLSCKSEAP